MLYRGRDKREFYLASLLYDSIEFRHFESVKSLLTEKGADPNLVLPKKGISPFHLVIGCEPHEFALKVTLLILQNRGNPNLRSDEGLTTVHIAAAWGRTEILKLLLSNGGDPGARDASGKTPLHYATEEGFTDCLNLLKAYLPCKNDLIRNDSGTEKCCLVLDKIIINNGAVVGEYNITEDNQTTNSIIPSQDHLQSLPKTDTTEYILNWFTTQRESTNSDTVDTTLNCLESSSVYEYSDESAAESDSCDKESKRYDKKFITFRKVYRKTRSKSKTPSKASNPTIFRDAINSDSKCNLDETLYVDAISVTQLQDYSRESGVVTLPSSLNELGLFELEKSVAKEEKSSDYLTCSHTSVDSLEKNIFELPDELNTLNLDSKHHESLLVKSNTDVVDKEDSMKSDGGSSGGSDSNELSFVSVSEVYKYVDKDEGVVLYERRLLKTPSDYAKSVKSSNVSSNLSSLPPTFEYDNKTLRLELTALGYEVGPITETTKRLYLRKLYQFKKSPAAAQKIVNNGNKEARRVYSVELQKTLKSPDLCSDILTFRSLDEILVQQFSNPDPSRKWREGVNKSSFTYLLLDPRITNNLPFRVDSKQLQPLEAWNTFLSAIFYVGKGKRSRPYQHLYDAVDLWKKNQLTPSSKKLQKIIDIWQSGYGVICLHVFLNIIPVEAYTREAAMISALKLDNLTNIKSGEFYGIASTWQQKQKKMLGVYLLYRALGIFLNEGERQLCPTDID
ncbi:ankyrin repeat and LEM domain-containing protein 1-like [Anthonomus grandis grandis]|uniref:ankyrin repeat and LEM domain-containing protein 1-like n=1 Tax=Anthonomus grandis grandis TaxID=2921223 RepID=UPI002165FF77|nr:ankyrin repeat and LEM domain-containing protein 1-like [Anthonomus grandis grandis]